MIVVHPEDPSTKVLGRLYEGLEGVKLFTSWDEREEILAAIAAAPKDEPMMLLGHGCPAGLYDLLNGRLIITNADAELLKDRPNLVGIWCYASSYAYKHGLKGFFSGMFISEPAEAQMNRVTASAKLIDKKTEDFCERFGQMMREGKPLAEIADELMDPRHRDCELTRFNYDRLTWRPNGDEPIPAASESEVW